MQHLNQIQESKIKQCKLTIALTIFDSHLRPNPNILDPRLNRVQILHKLKEKHSKRYKKKRDQFFRLFFVNFQFPNFSINSENVEKSWMITVQDRKISSK